MLNYKKTILISVLLLSITACTVNPIGAFKLSQTSLQEREMQSREYSQLKEEDILSASAAVLQDMGYTISESETRLGIITATKEADATNGGQVALAVLAAMLGAKPGPLDDKQQFTVTIVVLPRGNTGNYIVRMTMQRVVWNTRGQVTKLETIKSDEVYRDFFEKLSKAVFLEKNI